MTEDKKDLNAQLRQALNELNGVGPSLEEVTVRVEGCVLSAVYHTQKTEETVPQDVMSIRIGSRAPSMTVRYNSSVLEVCVQTPYERITKIRFPAFISLEQGDRFRAYLIAADEKIIRGHDNYERDKHFFSPRDLKADEIAIKIEKLKGDEVVATYKQD